MKKVLIITWAYPPLPFIGSVRLGGLAKYLGQFDWEPIVLTIKLPQPPSGQVKVLETFYPGDVSEQIKKKLKIDQYKKLEEGLGIPKFIRETKNLWMINCLGFFYGLLIFPEEQRGWFPYALEAGTKFLKNNKVDCLLSSSSPVICHMVAKKLKDKFHIPWLADFRDLWTQNYYYIYGPLLKFIDRRLEVNTLSQADALSTVSSPLLEILQELHKNKKFFCIPNGFDPSIVNNLSIPLAKEFTIVYTGNVYPGKQSPTLLFEVLRFLIKDNKIDPNMVRIKFFGRVQYWMEQEIERYQLRGVVEKYGKITREQSIDQQRQAQLLLFLNWNDSREKGVYTAKIFEYLAARRPILAVGGPKGVVSDLLETTQAGVHINTAQAMEDTLVKFYQEFKSQGFVSYKGIIAEINKFSHIEMAKKFAQALNQVVA